MPITVLTGPPGAGKTTVAAGVARSGPLGVHLMADRCFEWIVSGYIPPWTPEANDQNATVIEVIGAAAGRYAAGGFHVVVDGIVGPWFLRNFLDAAGVRTQDMGYVVIRPTREVARQRALNRASDQALVDPEPVDAMFDAFEDLGPFETHVVDTSRHDPARTVTTVCEGLASGRFTLDERYVEPMERLARRFDVPPMAG